jgi:hypothetical protein
VTQKLIINSLVAACALSAQAALQAATPINDTFSVVGDVRTGFYTIDRDKRDGTKYGKDEWRLRLRVGMQAAITESLSAQLRFAGRYTTHESSGDSEFDINTDITPGSDGLKMGQSTLDEIWLNYARERWSLRVGRMQTKLELTGVAKKSLDRNDSPNTDIAWTDGLYFKHKGADGWNTHAIVQYNPEDGATQVRRKPLGFEDNSSRISYFLAYEKMDKKATIVQRAVDITYLPSALQTDGTATGDIDDYLAFVGRLAAQWPMGASGMKFLLAGELGYAPNTPSNSALKLGSSGNAGGTAAQLTFNFIDIAPSHSVGVVLGKVDGGWLLSPDFKNNQYLVETRYRWNLAKQQRIEVRVRYRTDIEQRIDKSEKREDKDLYARYTLKF